VGCEVSNDFRFIDWAKFFDQVSDFRISFEAFCDVGVEGFLEGFEFVDEFFDVGIVKGFRSEGFDF